LTCILGIAGRLLAGRLNGFQAVKIIEPLQVDTIGIIAQSGIDRVGICTYAYQWIAATRGAKAYNLMAGGR
jgi:hypothetical protein